MSLTLDSPKEHLSHCDGGGSSAKLSLIQDATLPPESSICFRRCMNPTGFCMMRALGMSTEGFVSSPAAREIYEPLRQLVGPRSSQW